MQRENSECYETDLDLAAIIRLLWKRRMFIIGCSVIPAILFGVTLFFVTPKRHEVTRVINNVGLSVNEFLKMQSSINSNELKNAITGRIPEIAQRLPNDLDKVVEIVPYPPLTTLEMMENPGKIGLLYVKTKHIDAEKAFLLNNGISDILLEMSIYNDALLALNLGSIKLRGKILRI